MSGATLMQWAQAGFLAFFIGLNVGYILLNLAAAFTLRRYRHANALNVLPSVYSGLEPPVSLLV